MALPQKRFVLLGLFLLVLLAASAVFLARRSSRDPKTRFERIVFGMTEDEVIELLGGSPGDHRTWNPSGYQGDVDHTLVTLGKNGPYRDCRWHFDQGLIIAIFDRDGRLVDKSWWESSYPQAGFWERLMEKVGRLLP